MANQAIALQARAPQGNFLAPAIQQGAQFIVDQKRQSSAGPLLIGAAALAALLWLK